MRVRNLLELLSKCQTWREVTGQIFNSSTSLLHTSRQLSRASQTLVSRIGSNDRSAELVAALGDLMTFIVGAHSMVLAHHESVRILSTLDHGLEAFVNLRAQLEAALTLFYLISHDDSLDEVMAKCLDYSDWIIVKMHQNLARSRTFAPARALMESDSYASTVEANYNEIVDRYATNPGRLEKLKKAVSFVPDKRAIAKQYGIEDLYAHVFAEASATVHQADLSDRSLWRRESRWKRQLFRIRNRKAGFWPVFCSVMIQAVELRIFAEFLGLEGTVRLRSTRLGDSFVQVDLPDN